MILKTNDNIHSQKDTVDTWEDLTLKTLKDYSCLNNWMRKLQPIKPTQ